MRAAIRNALMRAPRLDQRNVHRTERRCKICGGATTAFDVVDFNKFCDPDDFYRFGLAGVSVPYWRCPACGFLFTDFFDDWSGDDFGRFVYNRDYVKVDGEYVEARPARLADAFAGWLQGCQPARMLDYGSGAGIFVAMMRAYGYERMAAYDPFSSPARPQGRFDIITCFEVIEHSTDPLATFADMVSFLADDGCIVLSQTVQPPDILEQRGHWWYLGPRNGHASTYADETLARIAGRLGLVLRRGSTLYAFARPLLSGYARQAADLIGPSFGTLRLFAPERHAAERVTFPSRETVWWHPVGETALARTRWTGGTKVMWQASWPPLGLLQVRIPFAAEGRQGLAAACHLQLGDAVVPARVDRGELMAEFPVEGVVEGLITLHLPPQDGAPAAHGPDDPDAAEPGDLAILTGLEPPG